MFIYRINSAMVRSVSTFEREFNSAVEAVERDVFINLVCQNPQLTLAELTKLGKGKYANLLSSVCVGDIMEAGGPKESEDKKVTVKTKSKAKAVNTRTPEGRRAYDSAVLAVVEAAERPIKAPEITALVGGTALQVRKALARLIELGKVTWEGKGRGMRYSAV